MSKQKRVGLRFLSKNMKGKHCPYILSNESIRLVGLPDWQVRILVRKVKEWTWQPQGVNECTHLVIPQYRLF